jgi:hypothetical protein
MEPTIASTLHMTALRRYLCISYPLVNIHQLIGFCVLQLSILDDSHERLPFHMLFSG